MADQTWRPLGVDTEEEVAEYDALHEGIPSWMETAFWDWVQDQVTYRKNVTSSTSGFLWPREDFTESMCQQLKIRLSKIRYPNADYQLGQRLVGNVMYALKKHDNPLQIADYIIAHDTRLVPQRLDDILERSKSAWNVGERNGYRGLVRRVPEGVQVAADDVMSRAGQAGIRLAKAWEQLYGVDPNPSEAYRLAILAVEDAAVPVTLPKDTQATLGKVIKHFEQSQRWKLPMEREHDNAPSRQVLVDMMRMLWHGQHDRHGGQPSEPGNVTHDEATVAVSLAVTLVHWFHAGLVTKEAKS